RHILIAALLCALALVLLQSGCYYDKEADLYPMNFCDTLSVGYSSNVQPIIQANCAIPGCHVPGGSGTGDFTAYNGLSTQITNGKLVPAVQQSGGAAFMPPSGKLSDCDVATIARWVAGGAQQN
ncbi:MAG: hypothetical protein WAT41_07650, partial [Flavobacteriales bacterium]